MAPTIGDNIARIRRQSTLTQEALAERAGLSVETIRKLETNQRTSARIPTMHAIARALGVPTSALVGDASSAVARREPEARPLALMAIRRALTPVTDLMPGTDAPTTDDPPPTPERIRTLSARLERAFLVNDYATALAVMPEALAATDIAIGSGQPDAYQLRTRVLHVGACVLIQLCEIDLAYCAARLAYEAAGRVDDPLVRPATAGPMAWLLMRQGRFGEAERVAVAAADQVEPRISRASLRELATWGWLLLSGAAAAARDNRGDDAATLLNAAGAAAGRMGEQQLTDQDDFMIGGFGAAKIDMMRAETAAVAGDPARVLAVAERIPPVHRPTSPSRNRHLLDVAWAHADLGRYAEATEVLLRIREHAPVWLRHQRYARDIVETIAAGRRRAMSQELAELVSLVGVVD